MGDGRLVVGDKVVVIGCDRRVLSVHFGVSGWWCCLMYDGVSVCSLRWRGRVGDVLR